MTCKTVVVGLDGASFSILDPLIAQGVLPHMEKLIRSGVRAELRSIVPPITPPAWTSLLTGRSPGHHGIFDFFQVDSPGSRQIRLATSRDVRCAAIWEVANRNGLRATVLNFPVTFPPPALDGHVIAGWMPWRQLRLGCHPSDLFDRLKALPGFQARELAMDMALEAKATEGCEDGELADWVALHIRREQHWLDVLRFLMQEEPSELTAILFDGPDKIQHLCWRYLDPALWPAEPTASDKTIRSRCLDYFRQLDQNLGQIVSLAGDEATIVLASDHGFGATDRVFYVNAWLAKRGYLAWSKEAALDDARPGTLGMNYLARHVGWLDWQRTVAYASTPSSNGIHIVRAGPGQEGGVSPARVSEICAELAQALTDYQDPSTGQSVVSRVWTREQAFSGPAGELAPDLTLELQDGGLVSILPSEVVVRPRPEPVGTHRPQGIFVAWGTDVRQGQVLDELSILDVASIVLHSLGLAIPRELEGRVPAEMYEPWHRSDRPVRFTPCASDQEERNATPDQEPVYDDESEKVILDRLRALGYID